MADDSLVDKRVQQFVQIRDKLAELEKEYDEKRKPYVEAKDQLEGLLLGVLDRLGAKNIKTEHGTCHTITRVTASLADADAFMKFVINNQRYDLLDRRANATAVRDYVKEHNALPPGANLNTIVSLGVRRK